MHALSQLHYLNIIVHFCGLYYFYRMKYLIALFCLFCLWACNTTPTAQEEKEVEQVDSLIRNDDQKMDSMKKALGL